MEEKKTLKIKKPYLIIFALAIAFAIMGVIDLKVNAAESLVEDIPYEEQYLKVSYFTNDYVNKTYRLRTWDLNTPHTRIALYYGDFKDNILDPSNKNNVIESTGKGYRLCVLRNEDSSKQHWNTGTYTCVNYDKNMKVTSTDEQYVGYDQAIHHGEVVPSIQADWKCIGEYFNSMNKVENLEIDTNIPIFTDWDCLREYLETGYYNLNGVVFDWSEFLKNASVNDDMPCVTNLDFDRIENTDANMKSITDYIRFDPNSDYRLAIMLCPSVYSPIRSNGFISKFVHYDYDKWIYMTTSDAGLKEISCNIGTFSIPTSGVESIVESNYKRYYETILYGLSDNGSVNFKPTMGYRLMYVDLSNNQIGPSTYILPNYYDNLDPNDETCSFFTLYSDGTKGSEKVMNLKTWQQDESMSLDDVKDVINKVTNVLDDYQIIDTELGVGDAKNWLSTVSEFIKGTPQFIGATLSFLPKPILYGMYVCIFMSVVAVAVAIFKALI